VRDPVTISFILAVLGVLIVIVIGGLLFPRAAIVTWLNGLVILCFLILFKGRDPSYETTPRRIGVALAVGLVGVILILRGHRKLQNEDPDY
jgi:hypothetical protein